MSIKQVNNARQDNSPFKENKPHDTLFDFQSQNYLIPLAEKTQDAMLNKPNSNLILANNHASLPCLDLSHAISLSDRSQPSTPHLKAEEISIFAFNSQRASKILLEETKASHSSNEQVSHEPQIERPSRLIAQAPLQEGTPETHPKFTERTVLPSLRSHDMAKFCQEVGSNNNSSRIVGPHSSDSKIEKKMTTFSASFKTFTEEFQPQIPILGQTKDKGSSTSHFSLCHLSPISSSH
ncbi:hypothetical protein O181_041899 [Austropuccinia psidii MF-1]|uniref:Uncharacterized protein n=1 Tax=Austropuccinia psidii MF-1 TaxID=1389203 RepID=A0A9Q3DFB6_9BASI|nr:hypothetical protein [Austropuccinia psidii MF-1]